MARQPKSIAAPERELVLYRALIAATPDIPEKSNFGSAYVAVNGNMASLISKHGLVGLRLPPAEREAFMAKFGAELFRGDPEWPPAREFVAIPPALLHDTSHFAAYHAQAYAYTLTLKPKPAKKG